MLDPKDQIRENANNLSNASSVLSPKLSMSILGAKVSYRPQILSTSPVGNKHMINPQVMYFIASWWRCRNHEPLQLVAVLDCLYVKDIHYPSKKNSFQKYSSMKHMPHALSPVSLCFLLGGKARVSDITAFVSTIGASSMQVFRILRHFGIHFSATVMTLSALALRNLLEFCN